MISNKKDWSTKGEILGKERPKDSLLTKAMDFEVGLKAPPIPDREFTDKLENMIKQRIIDDIFDDPIKKDFINLNEQKKAENELDFEKSKKGLGEIYEEKYLGNENTESKVDEIKKDCDDLCIQLFDIFKQMTNGTATPYGLKGKKEDLINITNIPAIQIEDKGNFVSDNTEKIKSGKEMLNIKKLRTKNKEEMTSEELKNIHNKKKRNIKNRIHKKENKKKLEELTTMLGSKFEAKIKMKQEKNKKMEKMDKTQGKEYKSGKFFDKINEMATKEDEKKKKNNKITE
jgi:U3 small nucleolar RNA-associated protein MPP10